MQNEQKHSIWRTYLFVLPVYLYCLMHYIYTNTHTKQHTHTHTLLTFTIKENAKRTKTFHLKDIFVYLCTCTVWCTECKTEKIKTWRDQPSALFEFVSVFHFQVSFTIVEVPLVLLDLQEIFQWTKAPPVCHVGKTKKKWGAAFNWWVLNKAVSAVFLSRMKLARKSKTFHCTGHNITQKN